MTRNVYISHYRPAVGLSAAVYAQGIQGQGPVASRPGVCVLRVVCVPICISQWPRRAVDLLTSSAQCPHQHHHHPHLISDHFSARLSLPPRHTSRDPTPINPLSIPSPIEITRTPLRRRQDTSFGSASKAFISWHHRPISRNVSHIQRGTNRPSRGWAAVPSVRTSVPVPVASATISEKVRYIGCAHNPHHVEGTTPHPAQHQPTRAGTSHGGPH